MNWDWFSELLELGESDLGYRAMALRTVVVFASVLLIVRIGARRFLSKLSPFDMLLAIMIGSIASRAITGNSSFGPSIVSVAALVFLHWLFASLSYHTEDVGKWLKGKPRHLITNGEMQSEQMRRSQITKRDIEEVARSSGAAGGIEAIEEAWLERDGTISIVPKKED